MQLSSAHIDTCTDLSPFITNNVMSSVMICKGGTMSTLHAVLAADYIDHQVQAAEKEKNSVCYLSRKEFCDYSLQLSSLYFCC